MSYSIQSRFIGVVLALGIGASAPGTIAASSIATPSFGTLKGQVAAVDFAGIRTPESDAMVTLAWIPGLSTANNGDVLPIRAISSARSAKDGRFILAVPDSGELMKAAKANDGWLNFMLGTETSSGESRTVDVAWNSKTGVMAPIDNDQPYSDAVRIELGHNRAGQLINGMKNNESVDKPLAPAANAYGCQYVVDSTFFKFTSILNVHSDSKSKVSYTYGATANSDVDAGFRYYNGAWGISGSIHVGNSNTTTAGFTKIGLWNAYVTAEFQYTKGHVSDYFGAPAGSPCSTLTSLHVGDEKVNPGAWSGSLSENAGAGSQRELCTTSPRSSYTSNIDYPGYAELTSSTATKISAAVVTPFITLGARSGYGTNVKLRWDTTASPGVTLCGQNNKINLGPGIVYAQNR